MSQGLPPLVRERPDHSQRIFDCSGITPARAGKTLLLPVTVAAFKDHPRSCGKDDYPALTAYEKQGSPPLVRERHIARQRKRKLGGITPARAGKTGAEGLGPSTNGDHPRSCGKDVPCWMMTAWPTGSPPLVRERLCRLLRKSTFGGITPARAGKTQYAAIRTA